MTRVSITLKSTDELLRLARGPLAPADRKAVEAEIATRSPAPAKDSKEQLKLFSATD